MITDMPKSAELAQRMMKTVLEAGVDLNVPMFVLHTSIHAELLELWRNSDAKILDELGLAKEVGMFIHPTDVDLEQPDRDSLYLSMIAHQVIGLLYREAGHLKPEPLH